MRPFNVTLNSPEANLVPEALSFLRDSPKTHFIGGKWIAPVRPATAEVIDPSTGAALTTIPLGGPEEVDAAVRATEAAFPRWAAMPPEDRAVLLHRLADLIERKATALAQIEALDVGKALTDAESFDVPFGGACIRYFADFALSARYDVPLAIRNIEARIHRAPYGPCGFIFPWNFPFDLLMWGIMPALAAGNTVVVKPSEITPLSTLYVCQLAAEVGFPPGVINVVLGDGAGAGAALARHPGIRRMSFTGSPTVGRQIAEVCGRNLVPCKLELGGKGAAVVFDDVDIDAAARKLAAAITLNTGQVCCTATRWIVQDSVFERFADSAVAALQSVKIGPSLSRETQMGPLASKAQLQRVLGYVERGQRDGAVAILSGGKASIDGGDAGYYVKPALLTGSEENVCCSEEIFGPVAYLLKFREEAEAIRAVNRLRYGLANSVWSGDLARASRVAEQMVAGNSWINAHNVFAYGLPYGGVNLSGMGGGVNSPETFYDYLRSQTIAKPLE